MTRSAQLDRRRLGIALGVLVVIVAAVVMVGPGTMIFFSDLAGAIPIIASPMGVIGLLAALLWFPTMTLVRRARTGDSSLLGAAGWELAVLAAMIVPAALSVPLRAVVEAGPSALVYYGLYEVVTVPALGWFGFKVWRSVSVQRPPWATRLAVLVALIALVVVWFGGSWTVFCALLFCG